MQFQANKRALARAVGRAAAIGEAVTVAATHDSSGQHAAISASDGDIALSVRVRVDLVRAGSFRADGRTLKAALANARAADVVTLAVEDGARMIGAAPVADEGRMWVADGEIRRTVAESESWPAGVKLAAGGATAIWPHGDLAAALDRVSFAMSTEETRPYLRGVFLFRAGERVGMAASDGHRLAVTETPLAAGDGDDWPENGADAGLILPAAAVKALRKATTGDGDDMAFVRVAPDGIEASGPDYGLTARAVDGLFPDFRRIVPDTAGEGRATVHFDLGAFGASIRRAKPAKGETVLLNGYAQIGQTVIDGGPRLNGDAIRFNAGYLADFGAAFGGPVNMNYDTAGGPAVFQSPAAPGYLGLLMPMRA